MALKIVMQQKTMPEQAPAIDICFNGSRTRVSADTGERTNHCPKPVETN